jgi:ABC-type multidrug transport system fused ATPase/permease subunit
LAWFGLIAFPIVIVPIAMFGKKIKKITRRTNESTAALPACGTP